MINVYMQNINQNFALLRSKTGVVYGHQCGGGMCLQKEVDGFIVPLTDGLSGMYKWPEEYPPEPADVLGVGLTAFIEDSAFSVEPDVSMWDEADEAWVPVIVGPYSGYLIWENSD